MLLPRRGRSAAGAGGGGGGRRQRWGGTLQQAAALAMMVLTSLHLSQPLLSAMGPCRPHRAKQRARPRLCRWLLVFGDDAGGRSAHRQHACTTDRTGQGRRRLLRRRWGRSAAVGWPQRLQQARCFTIVLVVCRHKEQHQYAAAALPSRSPPPETLSVPPSNPHSLRAAQSSARSCWASGRASWGQPPGAGASATASGSTHKTQRRVAAGKCSAASGIQLQCANSPRSWGRCSP